MLLSKENMGSTPDVHRALFVKRQVNQSYLHMNGEDGAGRGALALFSLHCCIDFGVFGSYTRMRNQHTHRSR